MDERKCQTLVLIDLGAKKEPTSESTNSPELCSFALASELTS